MAFDFVLGESDRVRAFERPVGTWTVTGGADGTVRYEWMTGGHFLIQHADASIRIRLPRSG